MPARIDRVAQKYDPNALIEFFEELGGFDPDASGFAGGFDKGEVLGALVLEDGLEIPLLAVPVRDARKKQRAAFEQVTRFLSERLLEAALVVFHDEGGAYRMGLVHVTAWRGRRKPRYSDYRQASLLVDSVAYVVG